MRPRIRWFGFLTPVLVLVLFSVAILALPGCVNAQGLEISGGWAHVTGDFGTDGFDVGGAWWFTKRVTIAGNYDSGWDATSLGNFAFTDLGAIAVHSHLQSVLFGPRIFFTTKWTDKHRLNPFGEAEFGVSHLRQTVEQASLPSVSASDTEFAWLVGGGADYRLTSHFSARGNLDFLRTHFAQSGQSRLRLVLGITYSFGSH